MGRSSVVGIVTLAGVEVVRMAVESWVWFYCRMSLSVAHCGSVSVVNELCRSMSSQLSTYLVESIHVIHYSIK